jgi:putative colanic acid biosynthesis acetyltransferase WcaF
LKELVDLKSFSNEGYIPSKSKLKILVWNFVNVLFFINPLNPFSSLKIFLLKLFGAEIGVGVVIKQGVNIKYPWFLSIGDYSWIGENVWIDNLAHVDIQSNVCISQGAMLLTGNHNFTKSTFDLILGEISLESGVWIGAKSVVCPGVRCKTHAVLTVGSVATTHLEPYSVNQGNPALNVKARKMSIS